MAAAALLRARLALAVVVLGMLLLIRLVLATLALAALARTALVWVRHNTLASEKRHPMIDQCVVMPLGTST